MGLDVSHETWSGPYSMFMKWREWLAQQIGVPLLAMENYCTGVWLFTGDAGFPRKADYKPIPWGLLQPDPLFTLLNHSGCEGVIPLAELPELERRLREIAATADDKPGRSGSEHARGCYDSMVAATLRFADGCARAFGEGEDLEFH